MCLVFIALSCEAYAGSLTIAEELELSNLALATMSGKAEDHYRLGIWLYRHKDYKGAFNNLSKGAEKGHALSQYNLGVMYFNGEGVAQNYEEAFRLFSSATIAPETQLDAHYMQAYMYDKGLYVEQDSEMAHSYYYWTAMRGHEKSQDVLGIKVIPAEDLAILFNQNKLKLKKLYGNKKIIVRGRVEDVTSEALTDKPVVVFEAQPESYALTFVKCSVLEEEPPQDEDIPEGLDEYFEPAIYSIQKGKYATIEGTLSDFGTYSRSMKDCKILATD